MVNFNVVLMNVIMKRAIRFDCVVIDIVIVIVVFVNRNEVKSESAFIRFFAMVSFLANRLLAA